MKNLLSPLLTRLTSMLLLFGTAQAQQGLLTHYYNGSDFEELVVTTYSDDINDSWNEEPPVPGLDPHKCSIRWTGILTPDLSGEYKFSARVDDGIRVWIDDRLIIDEWDLNDIGLFEGNIDLIANNQYKLKVEYFNALLEAEVTLFWKLPSEEKGWFEYFFGDDETGVVIPSKYFIQPEEKVEVPNEKPVIIEQEEPKLQTIKKPNVEQKEKIKSVTPITVTQTPHVEKSIKTKEAEKFIPKNLAFEKGNTTILESSFGELDIFAKFMLRNPHVSVKIEGHTAPNGDQLLNLRLSKERAFKIAKYLVNVGVDSNRIKTVGLGGSQPLHKPEDGSAYPESRRVVFVLSGIE